VPSGKEVVEEVKRPTMYGTGVLMMEYSFILKDFMNVNIQAKN
jgi:hypothetical protein